MGDVVQVRPCSSRGQRKTYCLRATQAVEISIHARIDHLRSLCSYGRTSAPLLSTANDGKTPEPRWRRGSYAKRSAREQRERLDARFREIAESFHKVQSSVQGLEPEQVLVLETIGDTVEGLAKACEQIPGLEWLAELDVDDVDPIAGFKNEKHPEQELTCRLYAVMTNQESINRLIGLWDDWCSDPGKQAQRNFGPFKNLFINLRELRRWNAEDRIHATGVLEYLTERIEDGTERIRFEVELWSRQSEQSRTRAYDTLSSLVITQGGRCVSQVSRTGHFLSRRPCRNARFGRQRNDRRNFEKEVWVACTVRRRDVPEAFCSGWLCFREIRTRRFTNNAFFR